MNVTHEHVKCRCHGCDAKESDVSISCSTKRGSFVIYFCDSCAKKLARSIVGIQDNYGSLIANLRTDAEMLEGTSFGRGISQDCEDAAAAFEKMSGWW